eukprot:m.951136 g.951136  ORF g.951136 m.951136 type:complete len:51 (+) comp23862_c0_seq3:5695-5847(+)
MSCVKTEGANAASNTQSVMLIVAIPFLRLDPMQVDFKVERDAPTIGSTVF